MSAAADLRAFLGNKAGGAGLSEPLSPELVRRLAERTAAVPFFAHSYPFIRNFDHGGFTPADLAAFAHRHDLKGLCLHINDGGERSVGRMSAADLAAFRRLLAEKRLALHLEISSTAPAEVDRAAVLAAELGVENIRFYARHAGPLSAVLAAVYRDLGHATEVANARGLHFDYEQHEDLRAAEIAGLIERIGDPRLNVLFDFTNSWNAYEEPLAALRILASLIRQVHIKGGRKIVSEAGWGQAGVPQGSAEDELPAALLLAELLLLGAARPQVIAFGLENEAGYLAPPFRGPHEGPEPLIAAREPSETPLAAGAPIERQLADERGWAGQQVSYNRTLAGELHRLATAMIEQSEQRRAAPGGI
jgi:sugar phosphate isomerase/epimerase